MNTAAASTIVRAMRVITPRDTSILMYHGIPRSSQDHDGLDARGFESHVLFLKSACRFISVNQLHEKRSQQGPHRVLLTFDDGFRNNFEVIAPILRRHRIPAIFFVSSRHCESGKYLWFAYLRALARTFKGNGVTFRGEFFDMSAAHRGESVLRLRDLLLSMTPHPSAMYHAIDNELPYLSDFVSRGEEADHFAGMTEEHVGELAADPLFKVGVHTLDHALLSRCEEKEGERQLIKNQAFLERVTGQSCEWVAWPGGDYNLSAVDVCRQSGLRGGFAVDPRLNLMPEWEVPRVGIYSSRLNEVSFKTALCRVMSSPGWLKVRVFLNRLRHGDAV